MNTQKVAITVPKNILIMIDTISKSKGLSRSKYISTVLKKNILDEKAQQLKDTYDKVFSDDSIQAEQLSTAKWFEEAGKKGGQEW